MMRAGTTLVIAVLLVGAPEAAQAPSAAKLRVTQSRLAALCLDGQRTADRRRWALPAGAYTMAFTMNNEPRPGVAAQSADSPGVATVTFTLEAGHEYEVEVRAPPETFSRRLWEREQWTPVVRDRTVDRIVSSDPHWTGEACHP